MKYTCLSNCNLVIPCAKSNFLNPKLILLNQLASLRNVRKEDFNDLLCLVELYFYISIFLIITLLDSCYVQFLKWISFKFAGNFTVYCDSVDYITACMIFN